MRSTEKPITVTIEDAEGNEVEHTLPTRWEICGCCDGNGTTSRHVERDGGGFTASEWAEEDPEFREDYLAGFYDRRCDKCRGTGKVRVVDEERCKPELLAAWHEELEADREWEAEQRAERRMLGGGW